MSDKAVTTTEYPGVAGSIHKHLPNIPFTASMTGTEANLDVAAEHLLPLMRGLLEKKDLAFEYLRNITAIDMQEEGLLCKYNLYSISRNHSVQVTVATPPGNPRIPTVTGIYQAANWHEREAAEMVGLEFVGHPNPKNLLLEEDLRIHPLLKAHPLQKVEILQGIEDNSAGFNF